MRPNQSRTAQRTTAGSSVTRAAPRGGRGEQNGAPGSYDELRLLLQARLPELAPGQARIARVVLSDPEGTAFRTISETAGEAQVAESSVARFAASVGLSGYPALVALCRQQLAERTQLLRRFSQAQQFGPGGGLLSAVAEHDQRNIAHTISQIDSDAWDAAVKALASAPAVHVIGLRKCFAVSYLLAYLLRLVRTEVHLLGQAAAGLVDELRDIAADEVFVAASIHRYTADTVTALAFAKQRGLRTIVLTDNPASPLVPHGEVVFFVEAGGVTVMRSLAAFTSLVQALATAVALELGTKSRSELLHDEQLLDAFGTYAAKGQPPPGQLPSPGMGADA